MPAKGRLKNLKPGGRPGSRKRKFPNRQELDFCSYYVKTGGNVKQSALMAKIGKDWAYDLLEEPRIKAQIEQYREQQANNAFVRAGHKLEVTREFLDKEFTETLTTMETHERIGDLAKVKMFEIGYKRTGDIQSARVSVSQQQAQGQVTAPGTTAFQVYESAWLRRKKEGWDQQLTEKYKQIEGGDRQPG